MHVRFASSRRHVVGSVASFLASLLPSAALAINVEFQASGVTVLQNRSDVEMEAPSAVQGRQALEFRDADGGGGPHWTPTGTVEGGSGSQAWLRDSGASITTTTTVASTAVSIHLQGDDNDGRCDLYVGGNLKATIDMNNVGVNDVEVIVDGLANNTYTIDVDDLGASGIGTGDDCAVWGAAVLGPAPVLDAGDIGHVIVLMMENRSFDHSLGWVAGADGHLALPVETYNTEPDDTGSDHMPAPLASDYQGCGNADPGHTHDAGRCQWHGGLADGWLFEDPPVGDCTTGSDTYAIGYYVESDLDFYSGVAANWTVFDRYFAAMMAGTFANKMFQYSADTDRLFTGDTTPDPLSGSGCTGLTSQMPTIFDLLDGAAVSWRYYYVDAPLLTLWGTKYLADSFRISQFYADAAPGTKNLPAVSFIDPKFLVEQLGTSIDDHPRADIRAGQKFMNDVYEAVVGSDEWTEDGDVVFIVTHDEWGGFFDHVDPKAEDVGGNPPQGTCQANLESAYGLAEHGLRGFRIPAMVISPWAPHGSVDSGLYDAVSILKMIEWNWGLGNLNDRDLTSTNLAAALTATQDTTAPSFVIDPAPNDSPPCPGGGGGEDHWKALHTLAGNLGFDVPPYPEQKVPLLAPGGFAAMIGGLAAVAWLSLWWRRRRH